MLERVVEQDTQTRAELGAKLESKEQETERLREAVMQAEIKVLKHQHRLEIDQLQATATRIKLRDQQLVALQQRLESMHASKLLTDSELQNLEDKIIDSYEDDDTAQAHGEDEVSKLIALAERMVHDAPLARQLRRKFISL